MQQTTHGHVPVLADPVIRFLAPRDGGRYVDATAGAGGHGELLLERSSPSGMLLALDTDPTAVERVRRRLARFGSRVTVVHANFRDVLRVARDAGWETVEGLLLDLGFSSVQLETGGRGISFNRDEPLDMRLDPTEPVPTAADLLASLSESELADLLFLYGEEPAARRIARRVVAERATQLVRTTAELRALVHVACGGRRDRRIDPATRTFQALRIAVNQEIDALYAVLPQAVTLLAPGGRLAVISFHSLEDRVVKQFFAREAAGCLCPPEVPVCRCGHVASVRPLTRTPVTADDEELAVNPRARSAKLRVAERLVA